MYAYNPAHINSSSTNTKRWGREILTQSSFKSSIYLMKIWDWYLLYFWNYTLFCNLTFSVIFSSFFIITFDWKIIFQIWHRIYSNRSNLDLSGGTIRFQYFHFSRKLWWKNCWKLPKLLRCRNAYNFKTIKDINPKFW